MDVYAIFWLVLTVIFLIVEASTVGIVSAWFAAGALCAMGAALLEWKLWIQVVVFVVVSVILLLSLRPILRKYFTPKLTRTNVDALTGKTYAVIAPVVNIAGAYGATVKRVQADIADGNYAQSIVWDSLTETDAGVFTCAAQATNIISNAGEAVITLTVIDSRGREVVYTHSIAVQAY